VSGTTGRWTASTPVIGRCPLVVRFVPQTYGKARSSIALGLTEAAQKPVAQPHSAEGLRDVSNVSRQRR
jgi:hypothetical protein